MHALLDSIGFSDVQGVEDEQKLIGLGIKSVETVRLNKVNEHRTQVEYFSPFFEDTGIIIRGDYNEKGEFLADHFFPAHISKTFSMRIVPDIHKNVDNDSFLVCADCNGGMNYLAFYLQNKNEMLQLGSEAENSVYDVRLSGMSNSGKILLGTSKVKIPKKVPVAKSGSGEKDPAMKLFGMITGNIGKLEKRQKRFEERLQNEDLYSVIDTSIDTRGLIYPDVYTVIGNILEIKEAENPVTKEKIYIMLLECYNIKIEVCVNKEKVTGEPEVGRRYVGTIWLQGYVNWREDND